MCTVQIIIPVYNAEHYIRRCLDSVKNQTFEDWQAIIVDDASSDGSIEIIKEYALCDSRFVYILQAKNSGVAAARNVALNMVSAEYVAFIDSDDYWERDFLKIMTENAKSSLADIVQCRFIYNYFNGRQIIPNGAFSKDKTFSKKSIRHVYFKLMTGIMLNHVSIKLIRTEIINNLRFDNDLKTAEDLKFIICLLKNTEKFCYINKPLYHYCKNDGSMTGNGVSIFEKLHANRLCSKELLKAFKVCNINNIFYKLMAYMRPYIVISSKIFRIFREKIIKSR